MRLQLIAHLLLLCALQHASCRLTDEQWSKAVRRAREKIERRQRVVTGFAGNDVHVESPLGPAVATHSALKTATPEAEMKSDGALLATRSLFELQSLTNHTGSLEELQADVIQELPNRLETLCGSYSVNCSAVDDRFRTMNGSCNNLLHPSWGSANNAYKRYLAAVYDDGISAPQGTKTRNLPSPRYISLQLSHDVSHAAHNHTLMLMQWGQFLDHDITHTPAHDATKSCGTSCRQTTSCFPIKIAASDPLFRLRCLAFGRSTASCEANRAITRSQLNSITSYIDASNVYGSSERELMELRDVNSIGLLRVLPLRYTTSSKSSLPHQSSSDPLSSLCRCRCGSPQSDCFKAGDIRANEVVSLTAMHTIWLREHNRIATKLSMLNKCWDGDRVFYETRKIVGAMMQQITYSEYLPVILGKLGMKRYGIKIHRLHAPRSFYDRDLNGGIANVFATAAFRFGHSQLRNEFARRGHGYYNLHRPFRLNASFFCPHSMYDMSTGGVDSILRGLLMTSPQSVDLHVATTVTSHLFADPPGSPGFDLFALNVQRGRDHGIPSYTHWRHHCGLDVATMTTFDALRSDIPNDTINTLKSVYHSVEHIDLFVGGLAENHVDDASVGRTFRCILGRQFRELQRGDRFWYETHGQFTPRQLKEIKKVTLAKVVCTNGDLIDEIQPHAFMKMGNEMNKATSCSELSDMNLKAWKKKGCQLRQTTEYLGVNECVRGSWEVWSEWSECSRSCGIGERMRMRRCNDSCLRCDDGFYLDSKCCVGACVASQEVAACCSSWSPWSSCSRKCAGGTRTRRRHCNRERCPNRHTKDKQPCNVKSCPVANFDLFRSGRPFSFITREQTRSHT